MADLSVTLAALSEAVKETEYKYFGDYEFSDNQRKAVDTLVDAAKAILSGQLVPVPSVEAWQLRCGELAFALDQVIGCFNAAFAEGLQEQMNAFEAEPGNLADLIQRRILFANYYAIDALREHTAVITAMNEGRDDH